MDIELLKTFLEVKNTRHFGKAAENLYLTQAAVSARIKQLETILGAPLFTRFRNNLQLTVTGERLVNHAETILIAWDRARQDVALKKKQKRALALGATNGLWDVLMQDVLLVLHKEFADLGIRAEAHSAETLVRHLMERTLDFALVYEPAKLTDLVSTPVTSTELILVNSQANQNAETAMQQGYVAVDWGLSFQLNLAQCYADLPPPVLHTTLARIALEFIIQFGGSAYLPYRMVQAQLGDTLHQVKDAPVISRPIFACYHRESLHNREIESIISIIQDLEVPPKLVPETIEI
ncbi:MAG: LysR family transcriptional regulator [Oleiphilaceae bacterium]|nr:LysR family transcriptional regulator [Oleiphilaceae bacterium]